LAPIAVAIGLALLWAQPAAARAVSRLPRSDYTVRAACATPSGERAGCLALQLVPNTPEARAHTHPIGVASAAPPAATAAPSPAAGDFGVRPQDLHSAYLLPTSSPSAQTIALVDAYNDPSAEADLATYSKEFGIPECTAASGCFKQVNQKGESGNPPFPRSTAELEAWRKGSKVEREEAAEAIGWAVEISLDIETARAVCQNCHIALVEANSPTYANLETAENAAVALGASEVSNSWAGPECSGGCIGDSSAFDHPGVVIAAAAGDNGYLNWLERSRSAYADFPASSPQVVAVGGTRLKLGPEGEWSGETVWNDGGESGGARDGHGAGGGGCSIQFEAPPWQQDVADWSSVGCGDKRAVADVSADADPYTGVAVYDSGPGRECEAVHEVHWCTYGGTSVATPLIAATFAVAGGADGVEYPARTLYENAARSPGSLHDVTEGSNGECLTPFDEETGLPSCTSSEEAKTSCASDAICLARTGYDGPTGVGTPDGASAFAPSPNAPTVVTGAASAITQESATLSASVDPNGHEVSECKLEYGTSAADEASAPCSPAPGAGTSPVAVSAPASGLSAGTTYHFRVSATNSGGTSKGSEQTFQTQPKPPTVTTGEATSLSSSSATLNAKVDPNGGKVSKCTFEYGTGSVGERSVQCSTLPGAGTSPVAVSAPITGLSANATYRFRISATNDTGTSEGSEQTFQTLSSPTVLTGAASAVKQTTATLEATVNPNGEEITSCEFEYGTTEAGETSVPCSSLPAGTSAVGVSASVTGLSPNTSYYFRISATNAGGKSEGSEQTFRTLPDPPSVTTSAPLSITQSGAVLNATVDPDGVQVSSCKFEYGPTISYGASLLCSPAPGSGDSPQTVSASLAGLIAGTVYHFRIVAVNAGGETKSPDQTLTTLLPTTLSPQIPGEQGTPAGQSTPGSQGVASSKEHKQPLVPDAELASTSLTESASGTVTLEVSCPAGETHCAGTVTLRTLSPVSVSASAHASKKPKATILTLAAGSFDVAGGQVTRLKLHLSAKARALLARDQAHLLRARATIFARDTAGATHTTQSSVTIRAEKTPGSRKG
jgi:hypothetical protein